MVEWSQALRFHPLHYPECKSLKILKRVGKPLSLCTATRLETLSENISCHIPPPFHTSIQSDTCFSCVAEYAITSGNTGNWRMWQRILSMPTWQMVEAGFGASFCCHCVLFLLLASTLVWRFSYCCNGNAQVSACVAAVNACWFKKKSIWWAQASARFKRPSPFLARAKPEVKPMMVEQLAWMPQPVAWLHVYPTKVQTERYWKLFFHEHVTQGLEVANLFPFTNIALSSVLCAFF